MTGTEPITYIADAPSIFERRPWTGALVIFLLLAATRIPLAPKYLYSFDSVNFALALDEFNPTKHQPQPPGYPMFVGLTWVVRLAVPRAEDALVVAGLVMSAVAMLGLWRLAAGMFGRNAALLAVALLGFNPAFWFGGITNQVRLCLAFCSMSIALLAWIALQRSSNPWWLYAVFAGLGLGAGFRPALGVLLIPLALWVWWRTSGSIRTLLVAGCWTISGMAPWIVASAIAVGGLACWLRLLWTYAKDQFQGTSVLFGASADSAWTMATQAIVWNGLGMLAWVWVVPFVRAPWRDNQWRERAIFLTVWFTPIFLFSALVHIGDPDQALASIPALCLVGGAVLAAFLERIGSTRVGLVATLVAALNAVLFFYPPGGFAKASGYDVVSFKDDQTRAVFQTIHALKDGQPVTILHHRAPVTWRHLAYYFPDDRVMYLPDDPKEVSWTFLHRKTIAEKQWPTALPGPKRVVLLAPLEDPLQLRKEGWRKRGAAYYREMTTGDSVRVGPYRLAQTFMIFLP